MNSTSFREEKETVVAVEAVGIVGNLEELSTSPQVNGETRAIDGLVASVDEI